MTPEMRCDFETRSDVDLKTRGAGPYFASPHWRALILRWSIDGGPLGQWTIGQPCPPEVAAHIRAGGYIRAFNASFERKCFTALHEREGWPLPAVDRFRCTAAEAAAMGLPRSLEGVGEALGLPVQKDKRGKDLIRFFSLPRRPRKDEPPGVYFNDPADHPEKFEEFVDYCGTDVLTEAEAAARIVPFSDYEQRVYTLDQIINDRGLRIDVASARAAIELAEKAKAELDREMRETTGGAVGKCSEPAKLIAWVEAQGVAMTSAQKAEVVDLLETDDLPPHVRRALEIRQEAAKTSVSKLKSMLARADVDGRVRGSFLMNGAGTGRWTSMGVNFANMPRPRKAFEKAVEDGLRTGALFHAFHLLEPRLLPLFYGDELGRPLHLLSDAIRGFVWAAPDHEFIQADYTSIEGVVIAWSSGEQWKVEALRQIFTDPSIPDLYRQTAARIMNTTTDVITKKHPYRQSVGKVSELALGFGGGVAAFWSMSKIYGVKLEPLFGPVWETADAERRDRAVWRYESRLKRGLEKTDVLSREAWIACELIKHGWREANPMIAAGWKTREEAIRDAIRNPGAQISALKFKYLVSRGFLWVLLPSGRCLAYGKPKLHDQVRAKLLLPDGSWSDPEVMLRDEAEGKALLGLAEIVGDATPAATAVGVNSTTKKWQRFALYGGLAAENDTQAIARDILVNGMFNAEAAGYPIVGHVYDEMFAEVPRGFGSVEEFERVICRPADWFADMPIAASGWRGKRYRKD